MRVVSKPINPEKVVSIKFQDNKDGSVTVLTQDDWSLVTISEKGLIVHSAVSPSLGFQLDYDERLKIIKD